MLTKIFDERPTGLQPMVRRGLADEVAETIREAIVSGRLKPGQRVREEQLAISLQVSRGPVREAMMRLCAEGLIDHQNHRGASITRLRQRDILEIYSLRATLDHLATDWACDHATDEDIRRLEQIVLRYPAAVEEGRSMVGSLDVTFHDAFIDASHHGRVRQAWWALRSQLHLFLVQDNVLPRGLDRNWMINHRALLGAVAARDRAQLHRLITGHRPDPQRVLPGYGETGEADAEPAVSSTVNFGLAPAQRRVIADDVVDAIRNAIADGRVPPGTRLREDTLAAELGVSRGPIREAILRLTDEGLLRLEPRRGATATTFGARDVEELFSLRTALEQLAARLACEVATDAEVARLTALLNRDHTSTDLVALDIEFHDAIFMASHHGRLFRAWSPLRGQLMLFMGMARAAAAGKKRRGDDGAGVFRKEHEQLVQLLAKRDASSIEDALAVHVEGARWRAMHALEGEV